MSYLLLALTAALTANTNVVCALIISIIIIPIMILITWREKKEVRITFAVGQCEGQSKDFTMSMVLCYINGDEV